MDHSTRELAPLLRALVMLAEHRGHMTLAAEALGVPQSSMSRRIHALEDHLGIPLVIRSGRVLTLTTDATKLVNALRNPLLEIDAALENASADADPETGTVRFGFPLTLGAGPVPDLLADFVATHPKVNLQLKQARGGELEDDLRQGRLDLAVMIPPASGFPHTVLDDQLIQAALPSGHHLSEREALPVELLEGEVFIANPPEYNLRQLTERWCNQAGFEPDIAVEVTQFSMICELIRRGLGIALLPVGLGEVPGVVYRPLVGDCHHRTIALSSATERQTPTVAMLSDHIINGRYFARTERT